MMNYKDKKGTAKMAESVMSKPSKMMGGGYMDKKKKMAAGGLVKSTGTVNTGIAKCGHGKK